MNRKAKVLFFGRLAGIIFENDEGYVFVYDSEYLKDVHALPISFTLPLQEEPFTEKTMIPFFDGLIPEGWLLNIVEQNWKINPRDRMGLLLACCKDCIGAVSIISEENTGNNND